MQEHDAEFAGIAKTDKFEPKNPPNLVISDLYKNSGDCNNAICYGIRILLPVYLDDLEKRLNACWRIPADSQDSFGFPNVEDKKYRPGLEPGLPKSRSVVSAWLPDSSRKQLWKGWKVAALKTNKFVSRLKFLPLESTAHL
jgi:hypothetical protein